MHSRTHTRCCAGPFAIMSRQSAGRSCGSSRAKRICRTSCRTRRCRTPWRRGPSPSWWSARLQAAILRERVIGIAIQPSLADFRGRDHRMRRSACVLRGVLVRGRVAAQRHTARLARTEVHPPGAALHALRALSLRRLFHLFNSRNVITDRHRDPVPKDNRPRNAQAEAYKAEG